MVLGKLDSNMQKNETGPLSYTIHKNKFKMDEMKDIKVRPETIKIQKRAQAIISLTWAIEISF